MITVQNMLQNKMLEAYEQLVNEICEIDYHENCMDPHINEYEPEFVR